MDFKLRIIYKISFYLSLHVLIPFFIETDSIDHIHPSYLNIEEISLKIFDHVCMLKQKNASLMK